MITLTPVAAVAAARTRLRRIENRGRHAGGVLQTHAAGFLWGDKEGGKEREGRVKNGGVGRYGDAF